MSPVDPACLPELRENQSCRNGIQTYPVSTLRRRSLLFSTSTFPSSSRRVPIFGWLLLLAMAVHAPLLLLHLPEGSFDGNTHMFFADHYAHHWFNPWNEKWFAGFSQTTYPPLVHQLVALFSHVVGLTTAYMIVQGLIILLLPIGVYRYARLWVSERAALYAAIGSIFL